MNDFDQAARYAAKLNPAGFLRWLLARLDARLAYRGWLDTRRLPFPGERNRICDTVADFEDTSGEGRRWAIVAEFCSEPQTLMLHRVLDYMGQLNLELESNAASRGTYAVAGALLNLTGPAQADTVDMRLPDMEAYGLWMRVVVLTLREERAADTLAAIAAGRLDRCILPWIPLMHGADDPGIINQWKQVADLEPDPLLRSQYAGLALIFAELAGRGSAWRDVLEGWNMGESKVVTGWRVEERRAALLRVVQARYRMPLPAELSAAIMAQEDLDQLARWIDAAAIASNLDDFRAAIGC